MVKALSDVAPYLLIDFVLENVQVVGGCHSYHIIFGVPRSMEDLLVEVQAVHADFILLSLSTCGNLPWFESSSWFAALSGSLQCDIPPGVAVKHSKEVVVRPSHYGTKRKNNKNKALNPINSKGLLNDGLACRANRHTCHYHSSSTQTCQRYSHFHTTSRVYCEGTHGPKTNN